MICFPEYLAFARATLLFGNQIQVSHLVLDRDWVDFVLDFGDFSMYCVAEKTNVPNSFQFKQNW